MKTINACLLAALIAGPALAAETIPIQLISLSPQISPATARAPFTSLEYTLSVSYIPNPNNVNYELAFSEDSESVYTHESFFLLLDPITFEPAIFPFLLDIPAFDDVNQNGLVDFFDPDYPLDNIRTEGRHANAEGGGEDFSATWNRALGESVGNVVMDLPYLGLRFTHRFNGLHYRGLFTFTGDGSSVSGQASLTNVLSPEDTMVGPLSLTIGTNRIPQFAASSWAGPSGIFYALSPASPLDFPGTNYSGLAHLEDGYALTSEADYNFWVLTLGSTDANGNQIPDLVEGAAPSTPPSLSAVRAPNGNGIELKVHGTTGQVYILQGADRIRGAAWENFQTITLATSPQTVVLPAPGAIKFFRLLQQ